MFRRGISILLVLSLLVSAGCRQAQPQELREPIDTERTRLTEDQREAASFSLRVEPAAVTLHPGHTARIRVIAQRSGYLGAIAIEVRNLPNLVQASNVKIPPGQNSVDVELSASARAAPEAKSDVHIAGAGNKDSTVSPNFAVMVRDLPFTLHVEPDRLEVPQGGMAALKVIVNRKDYPGAINIEVGPLPANVRATPTVIPPGKNEAHVPVAAAGNAVEGVTKKSITARGIPISQDVVKMTSAPFALNVLGPPFTLTADAEIKIPYEGGRLPLKIATPRRDYKGPIALQFRGLPAGVTVAQPKVPSGAPSAELELIAQAGLPHSLNSVQAFGIAEWAANRHVISPAFKVLVEGPPIVARVEPALVSLVQGSTGRCKLDIVRKGYQGPVEVELRNLPPEVTVKSVLIPKGQTSATLEFTAGDKAALGDRGGIAIVGVAVERKKLAVPLAGLGTRIQEPFSLVLQPASIQLKEGDKAKLKVKAVRRTYQGPIAMAVKNLPGQVTAGKVTLPEGKVDGEIEVAASATAPSGTRTDVQVIGTAVSSRQTLSNTVVVAVAGKLFDLAVRPDVVPISFGDRALVRIVAVRKNYKGPITIALKNLPNQVVAAAATIPAGKNEVDVELTAGIRADADKKSDVLAIGTAVAAGNAQVASPPFQVDLRPGLVELAIEPKILKLSHSSTAKLKVSAIRKGYQGPIALEVRNLPKGFKAPRVTIPEKMADAEIDVQADFSAREGDTVDAHVQGLASLVDRTVKSPRFMVRVGSVGQPPPLEVNVAPAVIPVPRGGSTRIKVTILRRKHDGPIHVDLRNLPLGVEATKGLIQKGQTTVDITLSARANAELGSRHDICAVASPRNSLIDSGGHGNFASGHLRIDVVKK